MGRQRPESPCLVKRAMPENIMPRKVRIACPMDCFDRCGLIATVENGRVTAIQGDPDHPVTRGKSCVKGKQLRHRQAHPRRLTTPRIRRGGQWEEIGWEAALDLMAGRLSAIVARWGPSAIWHLGFSGYEGLSKQVDTMFFNCLGGATAHRGCLCWKAGTAAQSFDFGEVRGHHPADMARARTLLIWGRNPVYTNVHAVPFIREARSAGARIILIDPVETASAALAHQHITVRPGTDGALALAMASHIIANGWVDTGFVENRVIGFRRFCDHVGELTPEWGEAETGIDRHTIETLAETYARAKPSCILAGYGLQRYVNGGDTIRSIDALGAITGNIGISGGGVNYANRTVSRYVGGMAAASEAHVADRRTFPLPRLARFLETAADPPVKAAVITKANPLVQVPDTNRVVRAFSAIDFKVVFDMFMTDTAKHADLVIPVTSVLEEEDLFLPSMFSPYINYSEKAVDPPRDMMGEFDFFAALAERMGIDSYPRVSRQEFLMAAVSPLMEQFDISWEQIRNRPVSIPDSQVPWRDAPFATESGRFELFSEAAAGAGHSPLPAYSPPVSAPPGFPLRLFTPHARESMHSQHFAFVTGRPEAHLFPEILAENGLSDGDKAQLVSAHGDLAVTVRPASGVGRNRVMVYQGWWHHSGSVNRLTGDFMSKMGENAAYNETFCRLAPA
jgi:anaerobic selenocysteine-containing dehydrogenase